MQYRYMHQTALLKHLHSMCPAQEEQQETDEFRDVSAKVERREALNSLRKAADIINATTQVRQCPCLSLTPAGIMRPVMGIGMRLHIGLVGLGGLPCKLRQHPGILAALTDQQRLTIYGISWINPVQRHRRKVLLLP